MKERLQLLVCIMAAVLCAPSIHAASDHLAWAQMLEQDWLLQARLDADPTALTPPGRSEDATGGCDGVCDGRWGFHTAKEKNPWWQVDLGERRALTRLVLWNRCDGCAGRASRIELLLSDDGRQWRNVYQHTGASFYGFSDQKPLVVTLTNESARFVRTQLPGDDFLHLDEVEVFGADEPERNLALRRPATQSSTSQWSVRHDVPAEPQWAALTTNILAQVAGRNSQALQKSGLRFERGTGAAFDREDYLNARRLWREVLFEDSLLDFDDLLFVKRVPGSYSHMSDQNYGWWSRPGGGVYLLKHFKSDRPELVCLTAQFSEGSFLRPELSCDGQRILFAYCKHYPELAADPNKVDKEHLPEDAFYHVFEMKRDGSALRQLTHGRYDDFDARYLPDGDIVFLSTRRGQFVQSTKSCATSTLEQDALPDSYVRCGGGNARPVAVYTLHVMNGSGEELRPLSAFENFEWNPSIASDGRILYSRWDYVDRDNMPYMSLWSANPDGTNPQLVYGNYTRDPYAIFEARSIPRSRKLVFTASAHHSITGGSLVLLDVDKGREGQEPLQRLTPEVPFPEIEGWPSTWYASPYPLSENLHLCAWSDQPLRHEGQRNETNALGLYLFDSAGLRELLYRDPAISSLDPIPARPRPQPPVVATHVAWNAPQEGSLLVADVYQGLKGVERGTVKRLRIVAVPAKTQPQMNLPRLGVTGDDPGKCILGTVPVEADGSAYFRIPSGLNVFFQALDERGFAVQTMRSVTYVQPGQTLSCVGCHEHRQTAPPNQPALAARHAPAKITRDVEGTWPLRFDLLVQPVLETRCVRCHQPQSESTVAAAFNLSGAVAYDTLVSYGKPSLKEHVKTRYAEGQSAVGQGAAATSALLAYLREDSTHRDLLEEKEVARLITWMDTYAQRLGAFSSEQEEHLRQLQSSLAAMFDEP